MQANAIYPFAAIIGQEQAKKALLIALSNPNTGGLLIGGTKGTAKSILARSCQELSGGRLLITLPLNITADMLLGSIDVEYALSTGIKKYAPGLLSRADGNILYIDEVNLLDKEILKTVLDTHGAGFNHVERDGISFKQTVNFTIIATMNPQEGILSSAMLDRFGMYVNVESVTEIPKRVEIIKNYLAYSKDISAFRLKYAQTTTKITDKLTCARRLLPKVHLSEAMLLLAAQICAQAQCAGHRAEIYLLEAAKTIAALAGRIYVLPMDIQEAAAFVLPHRARQSKQNQEQASDQPQSDAVEQEINNAPDSEENKDTTSSLRGNDENFRDSFAGSTENGNESMESSLQEGRRNDHDDQVAAIDTNFHVPPLVVEIDLMRNIRRGSGKRSRTRTDLKQGRYVRAELPKAKLTDLAFDATIRAAAPYQKLRDKGGRAIVIQKEDLRQKVREKRIGNTFLFVVDASGSMGARQRMSAVKGAIFHMLEEAYQKRDRVGMIAFRRMKAEVLLPITRSVVLAQRCLTKMPTGGKTPLADGLAVALLTLSLLNKKDRELQPVLILVTDGRANAVDGSDDPVKAAFAMAEKICRAKIPSIVIDTEAAFIKLGIAKKIAALMGASYYTLHQLSEENIIRIVSNVRE